MFLHQRFVPGLAIASYLVGDEKTKQLVVIDPTRDVDDFIRIARDEGLRVAHILETHVHADFVSGARELKHRLNGEPVIHCSGMGGSEWTPTYADQVVRDGDEVKLGQLRLRAMHTPGHTPEHVSWALFDDARSADTPWMLFSGDFVFVGDVGRPDLLGEVERAKLAHQLYQSVFKTIAPLPDFTEVFPGHGAGSLCGKAIGSRRSSTLGFERRFNPSMQTLAEPHWTDTLLRGMPTAPPYFKRMKKLNRDGPPILGAELPGRRAITPRELSNEWLKQCVVLDTRSPEAFAAAHVPGSISIPLNVQMATWAGWVLPSDRPLVLVVAKSDDLREVVIQLTRVGFDRIEGHLDGGVGAWQAQGFPVARFETISVESLDARRRSASPPLVLDVRSDSEWESGHIDGAVHIPFGEVESRANELPRDRDIAVMCGAGNRSAIATSLLKRAGIERVAGVIGGMTAYNRAISSSR
jgi:hydroxyacylglutathione hydrolase